ncbi:hypothetical protein M569_07888, partial [Genlisea aurea]
QLSMEFVSLLVDLVFQTLHIYDDRGSRKAVDDVIVKALSRDEFMKSFAGTLVQTIEKQSKFLSLTGGYRLLKWSCLLLNYSSFISVAKNAMSRLVLAQAYLLHVVMEGPSHLIRSCKKSFFHLFTKSSDMYKTYMEELREGRIPTRDIPDLIYVMLDFTNSNPDSFEKWKDAYLEIYVKVVLNAKEKPTKGLSEAFLPLLAHLSQEDFKNTILPLCIRMLKRNPEIVLESVGVLLKSVNMDLSRYANDILAVVLPQSKHADDARRLASLTVIQSLSKKSTSPDAVEAMFGTVRSVLGGSEGRITFPYQRVGVISALKEITNAPIGKYFSSLSPSVSGFLLSCYTDDG